MNKKLIQARKQFLGGLLLSISCLIVIVVLQWTVGAYGTVRLDMTISRHMGAEWWSALIFLGCNLVIAPIIMRYIVGIWRWLKLPKIWLFLGILAVVGLVGLSFCPIGLFDQSVEELGVVSIFHQIFSRGMFMTMWFMALVTVVELWSVRRVRWWLLFLAYGAFYTTFFVAAPAVLQPADLIFESIYLYGFFMALYLLPKRVDSDTI